MRFIAFFEVSPGELEEFIEKWGERLPDGRGVKILFPPHALAEPSSGAAGFVIFESDDMEETRRYLVKHEFAGADVRLFPIWKESQLVRELGKFRAGKREVESQWRRSTFEKIRDMGATKSLEVLPLVDWRKGREDLKAEAGVSYLLKTDENTILFDLGLNSGQIDPSPLLHNMERLGVALDDIDIIVISHNHGDHVGGGKWSKNKTFSLTAHQIDLGERTAYTPTPMTYPGLKPICCRNPAVIAEGVATIGTIPSQLFLFGRTPEQALAVNVEGKGTVIVVGCGHQTLPKIIERTESLFDEPIHGLLGGLHYPVGGGPFEIMGMSPHKYLGTGKLPWQPMIREEVQRNIELLRKRNPKVVGLSSHDSSEGSLKAFSDAFPDAYREIKVGESIII